MAEVKSKGLPKKGAGTKAEAKPAAKVSPAKYIAQTRQEARKVTWTTWKETYTTTILVLILFALFGLFFFVVDGVLSSAITFLLSLGQ